MAVQCGWATEADKQEIIEFIDYVFSKAHRPHDFATLLPKVYGACGDGAAHHFVVREDGRIAAAVLAYPVMMHIGGRALMTLGVGSVSTHPACRGKGYMKLLMDAVDERAREMGAAFAVLSGERQRYAYYGYEYGGYQMNAVLTPSNVRHALRDAHVQGMEIRAMTDGDAPWAMALMQREPCYYDRWEDAFTDILRSWNNEPFVVSRDGRPVGYGTLRRNPDICRIAELLLEDESDLPAVMKLLSARHGKLGAIAAPWQKERAAWYSAVCADFSIGPCHAWKIYDEARMRRAMAMLGGGDEGFGFAGFAHPLPLFIGPPDAV